MKRILAMILALVMIMSLFACGGKKDDAPKQDDSSTTQQETLPPVDDEIEEGGFGYVPDETLQSSENKPTEEKPAEGETPAEGEKPAEGETPAEGEKPAEDDGKIEETPTATATVAVIPALDASKTYKKHVIIAGNDTLGRPDPASNNGLVNGRIWEMTHNTLIDSDINGQPVPELAYKWEMPDEKTYIFYLEKNVNFHNGLPMTAADVIYTLERAATTSYQKPKVELIEKMEAIDDYTVKITLQSYDCNFLGNMASTSLSILCKAVVEPLDVKHGKIGVNSERGYMIGTGAYMASEWEAGNEVTVVRNDNYWAGANPVTEKITYRKVPEASARVIGLQTGEVDICLDVPAVEAHTIADADNLRLIRKQSSKLVYCAFNQKQNTNEAIKNQKVRQAIHYATNTDDLILALVEGYATKPNGPVPQAIWGYNSNLKGYTYDVAKAKALLAEAGYPDGVTLAMHVNEATYPGLFEMLQAQWAEAGITLTLASGDGTQVTAAMADFSTEAVVQSLSWGSAGAQLLAMFQTGSSNNRSNVSDAKFDEAILKANATQGTEERKAAYMELGQYVSDLATVLPLYLEDWLIGENTNVSGTWYEFAGRHDFKYVAVAE